MANNETNILHTIVGFFVLILIVYILLTYCSISFTCGRGGRTEGFGCSRLPGTFCLTECMKKRNNMRHCSIVCGMGNVSI